MDFGSFGKYLIITGFILVVVGLFVLFGSKLPLWGKLPGDIHIVRQNFSFHFPIVTCLIISIVVTVIFNLFLRK